MDPAHQRRYGGTQFGHRRSRLCWEWRSESIAPFEGNTGFGRLTFTRLDECGSRPFGVGSGRVVHGYQTMRYRYEIVEVPDHLPLMFQLKTSIHNGTANHA